MIITSIETFPLRIPFKPGSRSAASAWDPKGQHAVDSLLVKVTTDQGLEGWGESFGFTGVRGRGLGAAEPGQDGRHNRVLVPQGPGLGIDPDPDVISACLLKN